MQQRSISVSASRPLTTSVAGQNGEVSRSPKTINYRTLKPEKDGFFGAWSDAPDQAVRGWGALSCALAQRNRLCAAVRSRSRRCAVSVWATSNSLPGHIIWYFKGVPSRLATSDGDMA
jgi:DNA-directed RNA polymerase beta' subunit